MLDDLPVDAQETPILGSLGNAGSGDEEDGDDGLDALQCVMVRLQAARDLGADLPEAERRRMAAKAVQEVMEEL